MKRVIWPLLGLLAVMGMLCRPQPTCAEEVLRWERLPLTVPLIVGQERVLILDQPMRVGIPADLRERLRVQSADGALYLRANAPFEATRLQLEDRDSGTLILLDVQAAAPVAGQPALEPLRIVNAAKLRSDDHGLAPTEENTSTEASDSNTPVPVALIRYAAQNLYAPLRTVEPVAGIGRVRLPRTLALDGMAPTLPVRLTPLAAWHLQDYWVTAVKLTNRSDRWLELDPRSLQGDFLAATFQHHGLGPKGESTDTTVLYLVTRAHGLGDAVPPALSPVDPSTHLAPARVRP